MYVISARVEGTLRAETGPGGDAIWLTSVDVNNAVYEFGGGGDFMFNRGQSKYSGAVSANAGVGGGANDSDRARNDVGATIDYDPNRFTSINFEGEDAPFFSEFT